VLNKGDNVVQIIHLLVDDDYIDGFVDGLPKDKVTIVEQDFQENKKLLQDELESYQDNSIEFIPYSQSMKNITLWLNDRDL